MIRPATRGDIAFVQSVLNAPDNLGKLAAYTDQQLIQALDDRAQRLWIWQEQGEAAAFLWVTGIGNAQGGPKIEEFGVILPGRGIGTRLFQAALEELRREGLARGLWLAVAADNAPAIRLYERLGFREIERRCAVWHRRAGPVADALLMALDAGKGIRP